MRNLLLAALLVTVCGGAVFLMVFGGPAEVASSVAAIEPGASRFDEEAAREPADPKPAALATPNPVAPQNGAPQNGAPQSSVPQSDMADTPESPQPAGPRTVDGTVTDRFGHPLRERVWLLPGTAGHPASVDDLSRFVTAVTDTKGNFSLTLSGDGPWRLAVGPPGDARTEPADLRVGDGSARADVVLAGGTQVELSFEELPKGDVPLTLELLALADPSTRDGRGNGGGRGGRGRRGDGGSDGGSDGGGGRRARPGPAGDDGGGGGGGDGAPLGALELPHTTTSASYAAFGGSIQDDEERAGRRNRGQDQGGDGERRGRGGDRERRDSGGEAGEAQDVEVLAPPADAWRRALERVISLEDRAAGVVRLGGLEPGRVMRLALIVGDERLEGSTRFSTARDTTIALRVFPVSDASSSLNYVVAVRPLRRDERPPGIHWRAR